LSTIRNSFPSETVVRYGKDRPGCIGGHPKDCKKIEEIYRLVFPYARYIITDTTTAEMIKYSANVTLAGQVMIANELYQICRKLKVDWALVRNAIILDPLIGTNTKVPGPDGDMGFGGKCLPKDLNALIYRAKEVGYNPELLLQIWKSNLVARKNKNWKVIKGATSKKHK
jgi:UDPglucose 6-dehydrogenase